MGVLTLTNMQTEVEAALGGRALGTSITTPWINAGYMEVVGAVRHEALVSTDTFSTANGTAEYALPANTYQVYTLHNETGKVPISFIPMQEYFRRDYLTTGTPVYWTRVGGYIRLAPCPSSTLSVRRVLQKAVTALSNGSDVTVLDENWDRAIVLLAVSHGMFGKGEDARGLNWYNRAIAYMQSQLTDDQRAAFALRFAGLPQQATAAQGA